MRSLLSERPTHRPIVPKALSQLWRQALAPRARPRALPPGPLTDPVDACWHGRYFQEPYYVSGRGYDQYRPAYALGWAMALSPACAQQSFEAAEPLLQQQWERERGASLLCWSQVRDAAAASWQQARHPRPAQPVAQELDLGAAALLNAVLALGRQAHARLGECMRPMPQGLIGQVLARHCNASQMLIHDLERAIASSGGVALPARTSQAALLRSTLWSGLMGRETGAESMLRRAEACQQQWLSACEAAENASLPKPLGEVLRRHALTLRGHIEAIHWLRRYML
nr:hypothetical protein H9T68_12495 [Delftia sp. PS-11]